jgi:1-aminocyclopropane-1-carboxylate deaminase/D-cysteine desulfhydrase-like pyridoxal-dependent ACC family enzyme
MQAQCEAILQEIEDDLLKGKQLRLFVKREDLIHPTISGNKWRKLKYNLQMAIELGHNQVLTFGGAYSNHIYATAAAVHSIGLKSIGIIRGERIDPLNSTLEFAKGHGMDLHFVSREDYRKKNESTFIEKLNHQFGNFYQIPEGGTNQLAVKGCAEIIDDITIAYDYICSSVGTGGTLAGLVAGSKGKAEIIGFSALKGLFLENVVQSLLSESGALFNNWRINHDYHFGGYAKINPELIHFIMEFKKRNHIQLDPIYTGKMMYGIYDLIKSDFFTSGQTIIALHTGGLQGIAGINKRYNLDL